MTFVSDNLKNFTLTNLNGILITIHFYKNIMFLMLPNCCYKEVVFCPSVCCIHLTPTVGGRCNSRGWGEGGAVTPLLNARPSVIERNAPKMIESADRLRLPVGFFFWLVTVTLRHNYVVQF